MKRALVTGACGFVGRKLCQRLFDLEYHVTMVDDLSTGIHPGTWAPLFADYHFMQTDARNFFRENAQWHFDKVFHLAAVVGGRLKIEHDPIAVAADLAIDAEFFQWAVRQRFRPSKLVYFSSSAAYPIKMQRQGQHCPLSESYIDFSGHKLGTPDMTYGWAKLTGEFLAQHAAKKHDLNVVCYRPFSGYGEDQSTDYPFVSIINRVLNRENPLIVWGSGDQQRDFVHIDDCVDAVFATMDKLAPGEALNIGTGIGTTFKELAALTASLAGTVANVVCDKTKPEGVFARVADPYKLNQWFKPKITLAMGVKRALKALDKERKAS